jgi:hypothetical protein
MKPGVRHFASYFDPVSGAKTKIGPIILEGGSWTCPPPAGCDHDWVLIVEDNLPNPDSGK